MSEIVYGKLTYLKQDWHELIIVKLGDRYMVIHYITHLYLILSIKKLAKEL